MAISLFSCSYFGIDTYIVEVEVDLSRGLPVFNIVGMGDQAISESKERIRSCFKNMEFEFPVRRVLVNLSPANIKKKGSHFDLSIFLGILANIGKIPNVEIFKNYLILGEISLNGKIKSVTGAINAAILAKEKNFLGVIVPFENYNEAKLISGVEIVPVQNIQEVLDFFEKEISDFILNWAKGLGLEVHQDEKYNLLIKKPATLGYENKKPIIIQAHIDMVCEKRPEVEHDFRKDPINLVLEGDILSTGNRTTLGGDDGIGVAMAMAVLEDKNLKHPPVEVILTTCEEEDMSGALSVDKSWFNTNRVINIDHVVDTEIIAGSCGGIGVDLRFPVEYTNKADNYKGYKIKITGLRGGHSGEDIHKGRANANILLANLLNLLREKVNFLISDIKGGNFRLAIPREAHVTLALEEKDANTLKDIAKHFEYEAKKIYEETAVDLKIEVSEDNLADKLLSKNTVDKIIDAIILSPNGVSSMIGSLNVVESSSNLGEVYVKDDYVYLVTEIRATFEKNRDYLYNKIALIGKYLGGELRGFSAYPSWVYKPHSSLRDTANKVYSELFGEEIKTLAVHAGLECGCFVDKIQGDMDAISIGPNAWDLHSPNERLSVSSTEKVYKFLTKVLENLE